MNAKLVRAIEEFNKYRSPEAKAKLVSFSKKHIRIEFTGAFCQTCGFYDYFEDFRLILEEEGLKTKTGKIVELEKGATVEFEIPK